MDRFEAFTGSILELNRYLQKLKEIEMRPYGLRAGHVMCLYYLGKNPQGLTATELTEVCREDKAAVSRSLSQLIQKDLVCGDFPEHKRALTSGSLGLTQLQKENLYAAMDIIIKNLAHYIAEKGQVE